MDDPRVDHLYELPLDQFTAARNALAAELRSTDKSLAAAVKALPKPSVPAWGVNQLARRQPQLLTSLVEAGDKLRDAQQAVLRGGDLAELRAAQRDERQALTAAAKAADEILNDAGYADNATRAERIRDTLHALALDADVREDIIAGRLVRELSYAGIGAAGDLAEVIAMPSRPKAEPIADRRREERLAEARAEAERLSKVARELTAEAEHLREAAEEAERAAEDARAAALEGRKAATRARREAEAAAEVVRKLEKR
jgi:hypothetical protein